MPIFVTMEIRDFIGIPFPLLTGTGERIGTDI